MPASNTISSAQMKAPRGQQHGGLPEGLQYSIYALALAVAISTWFIVIRAPLWLDETVSMFLIKGGWAGILSRQVWPDAPAYSCLLWLWTKVMGTRELMLRISSVLPMLAAVYLLYRAARELFDRDVAGNHGDRQHVHQWGTQGHDDRDRVVRSSVGVDEEIS